MNSITYRQLQRLTVNELRAKLPCVVYVDSQAMFHITNIDSQGAVHISPVDGYVDDRSDVEAKARGFNAAK